ncbi:MAG: selenocysteine-specific translation elongation factor [Coriobacteriia bacterium]|nr:selenocysteine-specific translation elongation factor [Coriobacteriia bacterium]
MSTEASLILGTAGHIDHGKSSLIQALTGTDPDRLAEEKRRGITIELGFAQLELPSGRKLGVVDVPGHEKFVRQMVAGATGVDLALLVIAADDGIMPQTVEHLAVLQVLGVKSCVVALTKTDLVDEEWVGFITTEIAARLQQTPFAGSLIVPVSSRTGAGLDQLLDALDAAATTAQRTKGEGATRLPVDRVFTIKGHGTVITGTLWSGTVAPGDTLEVLPAGLTTRVRSVQIHNQDCERAFPGNRVALNLNGLTTEDVRPGDFLAAPGTVTASDRFDARLNYLDPFGRGVPFETGSRVHVAHGTKEVLGRVLLTNGAQTLRAGESALVQVRLEEPLPLSYQDRFIIRSYSPVRVLGGGTVLNAHPRRRTTLSADELTLLDALENANPQATVDAYLALLATPCSAESVAAATGLTPVQVAPCVQQAVASKVVSALGESGVVVRRSVLQKALSAAEHALMDFHSANPGALGMPKEALRAAACPAWDQASFDAALAQAPNIVVSDGMASHAIAGAGAKLAEQEAIKQVGALYAAAGANPPTLADAAAQTGLSAGLAKKALGALEREGAVVRYAPDAFMSAATVAAHREAVSAFLAANGSATAAQLKEAMGTSRKFAMPLLEYFDEEGLTRREGDVRVLE